MVESIKMERLDFEIDLWILSFRYIETESGMDYFRKNLDRILNLILSKADNKDDLEIIHEQWRKVAKALINTNPKKRRKRLLKIIQNRIRFFYIKEKEKMSKFFDQNIFKHSFDTSYEHKKRNVNELRLNKKVFLEQLQKYLAKQQHQTKKDSLQSFLETPFPQSSPTISRKNSSQSSKSTQSNQSFKKTPFPESFSIRKPTITFSRRPLLVRDDSDLV